LFNGDQVFIRNATIADIAPSPLLQDQPYYIVGATNNTFQLSLTKGGTPIDLSTTGSGSNSLYVAQPFGVGQWSPYTPMDKISSTAYTFKGPGGSSIYAVQVRLDGVDDKPNKFSLYQITPESGATTAALDARLDIVEAELNNARGTAASLDARLDVTINNDGTRIQDEELTDARDSMVLPASATLKARLDTAEGISYWLTRGFNSYLDPRRTGNLGVANQLISGPVDVNNNSSFLVHGSPSANIAQVAASSANPLIVSVGGRYYRFARTIYLSFTGKASDDYYINAEATNPLGVKVFSGLVSSATTNTVTSTTGFASSNMIGTPQIPLSDFVLADIDCVLYIPSFNYFSPVTASTNTTVTVAGELPTLPINTPYEVWSVHECDLTITAFTTDDFNLGTDTVGTKTTNRLPIARASWNGASFVGTQTHGFRYQDRYVSELKGPFNTITYTETFNHNLGFIPGSIRLYYYDTLNTSNPILIENEAIFRVSTNKIEVTNRYSDRITTEFDRTTKVVTDAYLRLIASR
jgi:hypothetical protein